MQYAIQSFCFRTIKDNAAIARHINGLGLKGIELCGIHADFNNPGQADELRAVYGNEGQPIVSIGVQTFTGAPGEKAWFEWAVRAGAGHLSAHFKVDSFQEAVPQVASWAEEFDVKVGLHPHGGYMFGGQPDVAAHLLELGGPRIGLCLDTAWVMQIGPRHGNPVEWVRRFPDRIHAVHLKDFAFNRDGSWVDSIIGEGNLDTRAFLDALAEADFDGLPILEYEGDPENPVPSIQRCVEKLRAL